MIGIGVIIQISYEHDHELAVVLKRLDGLPLAKSTKEYKSGRYKRCYLRTRKTESKVPRPRPEA